MRTRSRRARLLFFPAVIAALALAAGCFGVDTGHPNGAECAGMVVEDAAECEGQVCVPLEANAQGIPGLCSTFCSVDEECTPHDRCVSVNNQGLCLRACLTDDDCLDSSVCRLVVGNPTRLCLADPL